MHSFAPLTLLGASALALLAAGAPPATSAASPGGALQDAEVRVADEEVLKSSDLTKLADAIAEYYEAKNEDEGIYKALEELNDLAEKIEKKAKRPLASLVGDLQRAILMAEDLKDSAPGKGRLKVEEFDGRWGDEISYALHGPKSYRVKGGPLPLVLVLPDAGMDAEKLFQEEYIASSLLETHIVGIIKMPEDATQWTEIGSAGTPGGIANVLQVLREVRQHYLVDPDQLFLVGHGAGVQAAFEIASIYPTLFAGIAGFSGDIGETPATNFANMPTMIIGGADGATAFADSAAALEIDNITSGAQGDTASLTEWLLQQRRNAEPAVLHFSPTRDNSREAYWLRVDGFDIQFNPQLRAEVDRDSNSINITGDGFTEITLQLNDRLVDMDQPVTITINGEVHQAEFARALRNMLDSVYRSGDAGRLYSAAVSYDFPPPLEDAE